MKVYQCFPVLSSALFFLSLLQVMTTDDGRSKGFGFVAFEDSECAEKAVDELHSKDLGNGKVSIRDL